MNKNLSYIAAAMVTLVPLCACESEDYVNATAERAGISSLAVYFTSGEYEGKCAIDWKVTGNADMTEYVIPVPYYYPEDSDNDNTEAIHSMKVVAQLENNCAISPAITVLDLTQRNEFTYTDPYGAKRQIVITGQLTRSDKCAVKAFTAEPGSLSGVIDEDTKTISLVTAADLSEMTAELTVSAHATVEPDLSEPHNFNEPFTFDVIADNGTSRTTYTVIKQVPPKIANGYRKGSEYLLFNNDMTTLGVTVANNVHPTLACIGANVVLNLGDGSAPQYFKKATGTRMGTIAMGSANASGAITSDNAGNMLICNRAESGQTLNIYKTSSVTDAPTQFISWNNNVGVAVGARLQVQGDLNGKAIIIATCENSSSYIRWQVNGGQPGAAEVVGMNNVGGFWGDFDNVAKVTSRSANVSDGVFVDWYGGGNCTLYYAADGVNGTALFGGNTNGAGWGYNTGATDARDFNNTKYLAVFEMGYWPDWGMPGHIYLYDATNPMALTGDINTCSMLKYCHTMPDNFASIGYAGGGRFGDVLITPSEDGYFLYVFYASNTHLTFGGFQVDCIDK